MMLIWLAWNFMLIAVSHTAAHEVYAVSLRGGRFHKTRVMTVF